MSHPLPEHHLSETLIDQREAPAPFWTHFEVHSHDVHHDVCFGTLCAICGLHFWSGQRWRHDAVVLGDLSREYEYVQANRKYRPELQDPAVFSAGGLSDRCSMIKGCGFELPAVSGDCFVYAADTDGSNGGPDGENTVYIPIHRSCFLISIKAPVWDQAGVSPLRAMFRVLRHRFQVNWTQVLRRFPPPHDEDFFDHFSGRKVCINFSGFQNTEGTERGYVSYRSFDKEDAVGGEHYLAHDPLNIPAPTSTILESLEPRPHLERTDEISQFRKRFRRLPNELKLRVLDYVVAPQDWPLHCTRLLGPRFWKSLFNKNHPCFAWLWDLDQDMIRRTDPELKQDWELLFRKLSQEPKAANCFVENPESDFQAFRDILKVVPPGLEGRRRIWKLLEEMYIGDRRTRWQLWVEDGFYFEVTHQDLGDVEEIPVYWGRNGEQLGDGELQSL